MSLVRAWRRELLGASGVAVAVPGTVCAALALLAVAGGFGRLGSLGQVFSGPRIPTEPSSVSHAAKPGAAHPGATRRRIQASNGTAAVGPSHRATATPTHGAGGGRLPLDHHGAGGTTGPGSGPGAGSGGHGGGPSGGKPSPTPTPTPPTQAPPPSPAPTAVDQVVAAGTAVTSQLPNPAGTIATQTLQSVGSTVDQVLPIPAPGSSSSQPPGVQLP